MPLSVLQDYCPSQSANPAQSVSQMDCRWTRPLAVSAWNSPGGIGLIPGHRLISGHGCSRVIPRAISVEIQSRGLCIQNCSRGIDHFRARPSAILSFLQAISLRERIPPFWLGPFTKTRSRSPNPSPKPPQKSTQPSPRALFLSSLARSPLVCPSGVGEGVRLCSRKSASTMSHGV